MDAYAAYGTTTSSSGKSKGGGKGLAVFALLLSLGSIAGVIVVYVLLNKQMKAYEEKIKPLTEQKAAIDTLVADIRAKYLTAAPTEPAA